MGTCVDRKSIGSRSIHFVISWLLESSKYSTSLIFDVFLNHDFGNKLVLSFFLTFLEKKKDSCKMTLIDLVGRVLSFSFISLPFCRHLSDFLVFLFLSTPPSLSSSFAIPWQGMRPRSPSVRLEAPRVASTHATFNYD